MLRLCLYLLLGCQSLGPRNMQGESPWCSVQRPREIFHIPTQPACSCRMTAWLFLWLWWFINTVSSEGCPGVCPATCVVLL